MQIYRLQFDVGPAIILIMDVRKLCGALTLLLFVTPLGASLCGDCASGDCMVAGMSPMPVPSESGAESSQAESHCTEAEETKDEAAPCHDAPISSSSDCCLVATSPEPEYVVVHASPLASEIALVVAVDSEPPAATYDRSVSERQPPPCQSPRALYTLHSSLLI